MSDPEAKAERSKAKDTHQMPSSDEQRPQRSKKNKPITVEFKYISPTFFSGEDWAFYGRYRDTNTANDVIAKEKRKHPDRYKLRIRT